MHDIEKDNQTLIGFWNKVFAQAAEGEQDAGPDSWKEMAPSEELYEAARSLGRKEKVLDYGCGTAWAGIIAAKSGCSDVTAVDAAAGAAKAAGTFATLFGVEDRVHTACVSPDWLGSVPAEQYDGFICSNVLDVVPTETAEAILRESARVTKPDADVIIGLNYYLSPEAAAAKGLELVDGNRLYVDGVLRLVTRSDEEWEKIFAPWYTVEKLEYFAWPGEKAKTRRLFSLRKREET